MATAYSLHQATWPTLFRNGYFNSQLYHAIIKGRDPFFSSQCQAQHCRHYVVTSWKKAETPPVKHCSLPIWPTPPATLREAHPALDLIPNVVFLLRILHKDVGQVHGRYQAPDLPAHLHHHSVWLYGQHFALRIQGKDAMMPQECLSYTSYNKASHTSLSKFSFLG